MQPSRKMSPEQNRKIARLKALAGIDLCACGAMNHTRCEGTCRESHMRGRFVRCPEAYQVELPKRQQRKPRHRPFKAAARSPKEEARERFAEKRGYEP